MKILNLTRSTIVVFAPSGVDVVARIRPEPNGVFARFVADPLGAVETDDGASIPVVEHRFEIDPAALPPPRPRVWYVVSFAVLQAARAAGIERPDLLAPDTAKESAVRGYDGRIVGVRRFRVL